MSLCPQNDGGRGVAAQMADTQRVEGFPLGSQGKGRECGPGDLRPLIFKLGRSKRMLIPLTLLQSEHSSRSARMSRCILVSLIHGIWCLWHIVERINMLYLAVDPYDPGSEYEAIVRLDSQSGK